MFGWQGTLVSKERVSTVSAQYSMPGNVPLPVMKPFWYQIGARSVRPAKAGMNGG